MTYQELGKLRKAYRQAAGSYSRAVKANRMNVAGEIWEAMQVLENKITELDYQIRRQP